MSAKVEGLAGLRLGYAKSTAQTAKLIAERMGKTQLGIPWKSKGHLGPPYLAQMLNVWPIYLHLP